MIEKDTRKQYVIDCSVVVKWFNQDNEAYIERALHILDQVEQGLVVLSAPDILVYELFNALHKGKQYNQQALEFGLEKFLLLPIQLFNPSDKIMRQAIKIVSIYGLTIYDAVYIALAQKLDCSLITANPKCHLKIKDGSVIDLKEFK